MPDFSDEGRSGGRGDKRAVRASLLAARRALAGTARLTAAIRVQTVLLDLVRRYRPTCVAGYVPVSGEPGGADLPEALRAALPAPVRLLLPVLRPDLDLDWAEYAGPHSLVSGPRGLREPVGGRLGPAAVATADLVVVPALAVDRRGMRLGRGGGSYDRALARLDSVLTVALLHDGELVGRVPAEPHDRPVRAAIAPSEGLAVLPRR